MTAEQKVEVAAKLEEQKIDVIISLFLPFLFLFFFISKSENDLAGFVLLISSYLDLSDWF